MSRLEDPLELACGDTLPNRIAKAAMSEQLSGQDGAPNEEMVRLYERWGGGGSGLLITGNVMLDGRHRGEAGNVVIEDARHLDALERWSRAARRHDSRVWMQINHPGRQTPRHLDPAPVAPSAVRMEVGGAAFARPRALTEEEIEDILRRFAHTAAVAETAGFDGVQIHAAHGYLVSQFLSPHTNRRDDAWGGDAPRRRRFLVEAVRAIRGAVRPGFALSVKMNSADFQRGGFTEEESMAVIEALGSENVDLLEISGGTYERAAMFAEGKPSTSKREAFFLDFAEKAREVAAMPLMLTGGFRTRAGMELALSSGAVDVVGMARPLAVEPDLPARLLAGECDGARPIQLSSRFATIDSMVIGAWHQHQLRRMGRGLEPQPKLSRASALGRYATDLIRRRSRPGRRGIR